MAKVGTEAELPKAKKHKPKDHIEDEPGAEERFKQVVKRALNTPPQHREAQPTEAQGQALILVANKATDDPTRDPY